MYFKLRPHLRRDQPHPMLNSRGPLEATAPDSKDLMWFGYILASRVLTILLGPRVFKRSFAFKDLAVLFFFKIYKWNSWKIMFNR